MILENQILAIEWRAAVDTVGFVAVTYGRYWQAYVGVSRGWDEKSDAIYIAENGAKLSWTEAQAFFPQLNIVEYKTYNDE